MTALTDYDRLESSGLWRSASEDQRRDVGVSFGDATLVISDQTGTAMTHWSLAAVSRINPRQVPALFSPDGSDGETLELNDPDMIEAIERVQNTIARRKPRPGRLRTTLFTLSFAGVSALAIFWLPGAIITHTVGVVPTVKRAEIGRELLVRTTRFTGQPCADSFGLRALGRLSARLGHSDTPYQVVRTGLANTVTLPGGRVLVNKSVFEDHDDPAVAAGYLLAETSRTQGRDPLLTMLEATGPRTAFQLLTTGDISGKVLDDYAQTLLTQPQPVVSDDIALAVFDAANIPSSPYAFAVDVTGEATLGLIEADPLAGQPAAEVIADNDWISLQGICGE